MTTEGKLTKVRRTEQEKRRIIKEAEASGDITAWCKANGVHSSLVYKWKRGQGLEAAPGRPAARPRRPRGDFSLQEKRIMVEAAEAAVAKGSTMKDWAKGKGFKVQDLYQWRQRLKRHTPRATNGHSSGSSKRTPIEVQMEELRQQNAILKGICKIAEQKGLLGNLFDFMRED